MRTNASLREEAGAAPPCHFSFKNHGSNNSPFPIKKEVGGPTRECLGTEERWGEAGLNQAFIIGSKGEKGRSL